MTNIFEDHLLTDVYGRYYFRLGQDIVGQIHYDEEFECHTLSLDDGVSIGPRSLTIAIELLREMDNTEVAAQLQKARDKRSSLLTGEAE